MLKHNLPTLSIALIRLTTKLWNDKSKFGNIN